MEFFGLIFLIVYVGAVAILFLFVLMLFNLKDLSRAVRPLTISQWLAFGFTAPLSLKLYYFITGTFRTTLFAAANEPIKSGQNVHAFVHHVFYDVQSIGLALYSEHVIAFVLIGYILLTAMLGAIVLAMHTIPRAAAELPPKTI